RPRVGTASSLLKPPHQDLPSATEAATRKRSRIGTFHACCCRVKSTDRRRRSRTGLDHAEQTVCLPVRTGGEERGVGAPGVHAVAEAETPQPGDRHGAAVAQRELPSGRAAGSEDVQVTVAKVSDDDVATEGAERRRRLYHPPR